MYVTICDGNLGRLDINTMGVIVISARGVNVLRVILTGLTITRMLY